MQEAIFSVQILSLTLQRPFVLFFFWAVLPSPVFLSLSISSLVFLDLVVFRPKPPFPNIFLSFCLFCFAFDDVAVLLVAVGFCFWVVFFFETFEKGKKKCCCSGKEELYIKKNVSVIYLQMSVSVSV